MLDIAKCRCFSKVTSIDDINTVKCRCHKKYKIPSEKRAFYIDQNTSRVASIFYPAESPTMSETSSDSEIEHNIEQNQKETENIDDFEYLFDDSFEENANDEFDSSTAKRNTLFFKRAISEAIRYNVPPNAVCAIMNGTLVDKGYGKDDLLSTHKVRNMMVKVRAESIKDHCKSIKDIVGIKVDGKKTNGIEDFTITMEPGGILLDLFSGTDSKGITCANGTYNVLELYQSLESLLLFGSDGANNMTGIDNGAISCLERMLKRPLQRGICFQHLIELVFKRLYKEVVGVSKSPDILGGDIGEVISTDDWAKEITLKDIENLPKIPGIIQEISDNSLRKILLQNSDQEYMHGWGVIVSTGQCADEKFLNKKPKKVSNARFYNTASAMLRLQPQVDENFAQFNELKLMNHISVNFYIPLIMEAKQNWQIECGAQMFHRAIVLLNETLKNHPKLLEISRKVLSNNSYYCHYESILLKRITDETDKNFRQKCIQTIISAREKEEQRISDLEDDPDCEDLLVRKFVKPKINQINFMANSYKELLGDIDAWNIKKVTSPPLLQKMSNDFLIENVLGKTMNLRLPKIPHHSINNEKHVQETFKTLQTANPDDHDKRLGTLVVTAESRSKRPKSKGNKSAYV